MHTLENVLTCWFLSRGLLRTAVVVPAAAAAGRLGELEEKLLRGSLAAELG